MKTAKTLLKEIDTFSFQQQSFKIVNELSESQTHDELKNLIEQLDIPSYKLEQFMEYLDKNKDKLLSLATYTEGDPVVVGDDYAPLAKQHGKVVSKGEVNGTVKVKFEDGEYDIPVHHISRRDAVATESKSCENEDKIGEYDDLMKKLTESKYLALLEDDSLVKVIVENVDTLYEDISKKFKQHVLVAFKEQLDESYNELTEKVMSTKQKEKRERIVFGLKKNKDELMKKYGDRWESVMYAIATKKAMEESKGEVIFKQKSNGNTVEIIKDGEYFAVEIIDSNNQVVDKKEFSSVKEAERFAQSHM